MEDKTLSGYAKLEVLENEITGHSSQFSKDKTAQFFQQELSLEDLLFESFTEEDTFILSEEYVRMEGEYVMWQETPHCKPISLGKELENDYDGQLILPFEDSLQSLNEYFTLKTVKRPIGYN